jgi:membrane protein implicated in regulation of membrane protease activity
MHTPRTQPSPADVAMEVTSLSAGLGIVTIPLFPFALPGLLLVVGPLVPVALAAVLLAMPVVVPVWLVRTIRTRRSHGSSARRLPGSRVQARPTSGRELQD